MRCRGIARPYATRRARVRDSFSGRADPLSRTAINRELGVIGITRANHARRAVVRSSVKPASFNPRYVCPGRSDYSIDGISISAKLIPRLMRSPFPPVICVLSDPRAHRSLIAIVGLDPTTEATSVPHRDVVRASSKHGRSRRNVPDHLGLIWTGRPIIESRASFPKEKSQRRRRVNFWLPS